MYSEEWGISVFLEEQHFFKIGISKERYSDNQPMHVFERSFEPGTSEQNLFLNDVE
jgi:hypothetical protein